MTDATGYHLISGDIVAAPVLRWEGDHEGDRVMMPVTPLGLPDVVECAGTYTAYEDGSVTPLGAKSVNDAFAALEYRRSELRAINTAIKERRLRESSA